MTNEEARDELVQLANHFNIYGVVREALNMAIEALSCSEKPNRSDLIRRQDAIDELVRWGKIPDYNEGELDLIACVIGMLCSLPSAKPSEEYEKGWKDGQEALREEMWEYGRDRLD